MSIIKNIRVLTDEFIPSRIIHRDGQLKAIRDCLKPITDNLPARNILIHGTPGTGKTCISKYVVKELDEYSNILTSYVNCWQSSTRFNVLYKIANDFGFSLSVHRKGTPLDELIFILGNKLGDKRAVVILDEVDKLESDRVIYDLLSAKICLIMISNSETVFHDFDDRIRSRLLSSERIEFIPYSNEEVFDILKDRAGLSLVPGAISQTYLKKISEVSNGDARAAIGILRNIAEKAQNKDLKKIPEEPFDSFSKPVEKKNIELTLKQKMIYDIIQRERKISPSELYTIYKMESVRSNIKPLSERRIRTMVDVLIKSGVISSEGNTKKRVYIAK